MYRYWYVYSVSPVVVVGSKLADAEDGEDKTRSENSDSDSSHLAVWRWCTSTSGEQHDGEASPAARISMRPNITFHDGGLPRS